MLRRIQIAPHRLELHFTVFVLLDILVLCVRPEVVISSTWDILKTDRYSRTEMNSRSGAC